MPLMHLQQPTLTLAQRLGMALLRGKARDSAIPPTMGRRALSPQPVKFTTWEMVARRQCRFQERITRTKVWGDGTGRMMTYCRDMTTLRSSDHNSWNNLRWMS